MHHHPLSELYESLNQAKEHYYCKKKYSCITAIVLFVLLVVALVLFLWCPPSLKFHFRNGILNVASNTQRIAQYQPSVLYTWSKLLIAFFLWLTLAWGILAAFKCMKQNKMLYVAYQYKALIVKNYISLMDSHDNQPGPAKASHEKEKLFAVLLSCIERDPAEMLAACYQGKRGICG